MILIGITKIGFVKFIQAQKPTRRINHDAGWCGCAVGDYIRSKTASFGGLDAMKFSDKLKHSNIDKYKRLGLAINFNTEKLKTYGALQKFIANDFSFRRRA